MTTLQKQEFAKKCNDYARFLKLDYDFDALYALELFRYKLQRTRRCIVRGDRGDRVEIADQILQVEALLWKVREFDYLTSVCKDFHKKYGKPIFSNVPVPGSKHLKRLTCKYTKAGKETKEINDELSNLHKLADKMKRGDLKKALNIISKRIWDWWD